MDPVTILGIDPSLERRVHDLSLLAGSPLLAADEPSALVGELLARSDGLELGMDVALVGAEGLVRVRVIGILAGGGPVQAPDGRTLVVPIGTAARLAGHAAVEALRSGETAPDSAVPATGITRVDVVLAEGAARSSVISALDKALDTEPYVLSIPGDLATTLSASTQDLRATTGLLAAIALFAGAFLIVNTLSMTVTERSRELALLRAAGASRGQLARIVAAQAALLAVAGSLAGLVLGVVLGSLLADALRRGGGVPLDGPVFEPGLLLGTFLLGVAVTLAAAAEPARRAAAVSPVEALRARARGASGGHARRRWLVAILAVVAIVGAMAFPAGPGPLGAGRALIVDAVLIAAVLLAPAVLVPLGRAAGAPFARVLRLEERLARAAIVRDRSRSGLTVGALVVGLTMVVALGAVAANARLVATAWIHDVVPGDEVLTAIAPVPLDDFSPEPDLEAVDGVASVSPIATFDLAFRGQRVRAAAMSGADLAADGRLTFLAGERAAALAALDAGGAVDPAARRRGPPARRPR